MNTKTLYKISYGLYIIGSYKSDKLNGQIANTVFQITSEPATVAVSINKQNLTHECIDASNVFSAAILDIDTPMKLIGQFGFNSGRTTDKFSGVNYLVGDLGCPIITDHTIGFLEAKVINKMDIGSHTIYAGEITDADMLNDNEPMTYAYYHLVKGGKSPKTAPTYIKEDISTKGEIKEESKKMDKYVCIVCGYVYDPELGDPDGGVAPGTAFEDIPDDWVCPVCGASKDQFEKA